MLFQQLATLGRRSQVFVYLSVFSSVRSRLNSAVARDRQPPPRTPSGFRTQVRSVPNPRGCRRGVAAGDHTVIASDIHDYGFPLDFCRDFLSETRAGPLQCSGDQPSLQIRREIRRSRAHAGTDRDHVTAAGFHGIHQAHHHS